MVRKCFIVVQCERGFILQHFPKIFIALALQVLALILLWLGSFIMSNWVAPPYPDWALVMTQAILAVSLTILFKLPNWWRGIQFFIPIGLYFGLLIGFDPIWALIVFIFIWLVFANAFKERVPLYLTNNTTREALKTLVNERQDSKFLDMGCGLGGNVAFMSKQPSVVLSHGVETAPVPYILSRIITFFRGGRTFALDMWKADLSQYGVVYAFLSPEPMPKLWEKIKQEMLPGSVFVSNSFAIPGIEPTEVWELSDARRTQLFIYLI